jgi:hypothetical protein
MASGGGGVTQSLTTLFQARLQTSSGVGNTLRLARYQGNKVVVAGVTVIIPQTGLDRDVADNLITAAGADSGAPGAANTLYYVYISNRRATFSPESIRLSATAPSLNNGIKYLGLSGNAANWRFVGWVRLNATPQFESSDTNAWIVNYYNRLLKAIFANPGYVNDDAQNFYTVNGNWAAANGGVDSAISFIANGEDDPILVAIAVTAAASGIKMLVGVGIDGNPPSKASEGSVSTSNAGLVLSSDGSEALSEGVHTADLYGASQGGGGVFISDDVRLGAPADPRMSMVTGKVMV